MKGIVGFIFGAATGSVVTYFAVKKKFEQESEIYINEEISLMKDHYEKKVDKSKEETEKAVNEAKTGLNSPNNEGDDKEKYNNIIKRLNYSSFSEKKEPIKEPEEENPHKELDTEIITEDEFIEDDNYDKRTVILFEGDAHHDSVVIDYASEEIISEGLDLIGPENLTGVSDEEDDILFVRNHKVNTDFKIFYNEDNYEDSEYYEE